MTDIFFADLVREVSQSNGTGNFALNGAVPGYRNFFDTVPEGRLFYYSIANISNPSEWEVGKGYIDNDGALIRDAMISSNDHHLTNFSDGEKTISLTVSADWFEAQQTADISEHHHNIDDINSLNEMLDTKQNSGDYADALHNHEMSEVSGLADALEAKQNSGNYADISHMHNVDNISGLTAILLDKQDAGDYASHVHTHHIEDITGLDNISFSADAIMVGSDNGIGMLVSHNLTAVPDNDVKCHIGAVSGAVSGFNNGSLILSPRTSTASTTDIMASNSRSALHINYRGEIGFGTRDIRGVDGSGATQIHVKKTIGLVNGAAHDVARFEGGNDANNTTAVVRINNKNDRGLFLEGGSEDDLRTLIAFFRARRGSACAFLFRDPFDHSSSLSDDIDAEDQIIGVGDGFQTQFPLVKNYGNNADEDEYQIRRITRPVQDSIVVAIDGEVTHDWVLKETGILVFGTAPVENSSVTAGYYFDVPVRFTNDSIDLAGATHGAIDIGSIPLLEVREAS